MIKLLNLDAIITARKERVGAENLLFDFLNKSLQIHMNINSHQ